MSRPAHRAPQNRSTSRRGIGIFVAVLALLLGSASAALAADTIFVDGDSVAAQPNLAYGGGGRACSTMGTAVTGTIKISYNGQDSGSHHFNPGENLAVTFFPSSADFSAALTGSTLVPSGWGTTENVLSIPFSTTVNPGASSGSVGVKVVGTDYAVGLDEGDGRPKFQVNVNCASTITDTTPPEISYTLDPALPDGKAGSDWWVSPILVHWIVTDPESGIATSTGCDDTTVSADTAGVTFTCSATNGVGLDATKTTESIRLDSHGPTLDHPGATIDVCGSGKPTMTWSDPLDSLSHALSGVDLSSITAGTWAQNGSGLGSTFTYTGSAADNAGNQTTDATQTYTATTYGSAFSGVLQPINSDGSSRSKLGSTIPVKFRLSCNGTPVSNATARLRVTKGDAVPDPGVEEAVSTASSTTGNLFRYDATAGQYIFNLSTKTEYGNPDGSKISTFSSGSWVLAIVLDDGTVHNVVIQIVK